MTTTHIYTLSCPDTGAIRYVGKSNDLQTRLRDHISSSGRERTRRANWVRSLKRQGKKPVIESLDVVPESDWQRWEQYWIQVVGGCWGFDLTNGDAGGLGTGRCTPEMAKKIAMKLSGVPNLALAKRVFQYSASGNYIAEFKSVADGAASAGGAHANIVRAIKKRTSAYGSLWSYQRMAHLERAAKPPRSAESIAKSAAAHRGKRVSAETRSKQRAARLGKSPANKGVKMPPELTAFYRAACTSRKAVEQVGRGAVIGIYGSIKEAAMASGATRAGIIKCIAGSQAHAAGFQWQFVASNPVEVV